jgi:hypothetical protein
MSDEPEIASLAELYELHKRVVNEQLDNAAMALMPHRSYRPPIERVCKTCGGKCIGRCSLNSCNDRE